VPLGALLGGWLGDRIGLRGALLVGTVGLLCTCLFLVFSPIRRVHTLAELSKPSTMDSTRGGAAAS